MKEKLIDVGAAARLVENDQVEDAMQLWAESVEYISALQEETDKTDAQGDLTKSQDLANRMNLRLAEKLYAKKHFTLCLDVLLTEFSCNRLPAHFINMVCSCYLELGAFEDCSSFLLNLITLSPSPTLEAMYVTIEAEIARRETEDKLEHLDPVVFSKNLFGVSTINSLIGFSHVEPDDNLFDMNDEEARLNNSSYWLQVLTHTALQQQLMATRLTLPFTLAYVLKSVLLKGPLAQISTYRDSEGSKAFPPTGTFPVVPLRDDEVIHFAKILNSRRLGIVIDGPTGAEDSHTDWSVLMQMLPNLTELKLASFGNKTVSNNPRPSIYPIISRRASDGGRQTCTLSRNHESFGEGYKNLLAENIDTEFLNEVDIAFFSRARLSLNARVLVPILARLLLDDVLTLFAGQSFLDFLSHDSLWLPRLLSVLGARFVLSPVWNPYALLIDRDGGDYEYTLDSDLKVVKYEGNSALHATVWAVRGVTEQADLPYLKRLAAVDSAAIEELVSTCEQKHKIDMQYEHSKLEELTSSTYYQELIKSAKQELAAKLADNSKEIEDAMKVKKE